jgi:very-short-patch-repair endonuclease
MLLTRARSARKNMTESENRLWYYLRDRRLSGYKFVRELVIGVYIADFVCRRKKLIIEVVGGQHVDAAEYDRIRTKFFEGEGYRVLRFWSSDVMGNIEGVLEEILAWLENVVESKPSPPAPLPKLRFGRGESIRESVSLIKVNGSKKR